MLLLAGGIADGAPGDNAGPPFIDQVPDRYVYDQAGVFLQAARQTANQNLRQLASTSKLDIIVYTQVKPDASGSEGIARGDAELLLNQWDLGGPDVRAVALIWEFDANQTTAVIGGAASVGLQVQGFDSDAVQTVVDSATADELSGGHWLGSLTSATTAVTVAAPIASATPIPEPSAIPAPTPTPAPGTTPSPSPSPSRSFGPDVGPPPAAGPPYPDPITGQVVYDYAGVFAPSTVAAASKIIAGIEQRTGAEVVVYTQVKPDSTAQSADDDAQALIDQWHVGRAGFDDGLAIVFDMDRSLCHGQVSLFGADGYRAAYLTNDERQAIFNDQMLPLLEGCDLDGALMAAIDAVDANATPEHAAALDQARQINAILGLIVGPVAFLILAGWAAESWLRYGRDPHYLDDPSILMPAPPAELTPPAGALLYGGSSSRHALTTAMLDLASHGEVAFQQEEDKVGIKLTEPDTNDPSVALNRKRPLDAAELYALERLHTIAGTEGAGYIEPDDLLEFGKSVHAFDAKLEDHVTERKWFREAPRKSIERWSVRGSLELILGVVIAIIAFNLPSSGLLAAGVAVIAAGVVTIILSRVMPQRTMAGAMLYAMLEAYRRTLQKTMEQARSMDQVVKDANLPWIETPDQAAVWGVALGLQAQVQDVLQRSIEDVNSGSVTTTNIWFPAWYGSSLAGVGGGGGFGGFAPGLMSSGALPDFGGMMSAIGTVGNSPASTGSGGGGFSSGGFSGGGSGGGGGGAGGGF